MGLASKRQEQSWDVPEKGSGSPPLDDRVLVGRGRAGTRHAGKGQTVGRSVCSDFIKIQQEFTRML